MKCTAAMARGRLEVAIERLLDTYPLYGNIIARGTVVASTKTKTMAVTVENDQLLFLYEPSFVCRCWLDELAAVLEHEAAHVVFDHLSLRRDSYPDAGAFLIATETIANEHVAGPLPGAPLTIEQFGLPPDEDFAERYKRLVRMRQADQRRSNSRLGRPRSQRGESKSAPNGRNSVPKGRNSGPPAIDSASLSTVDDHSFWPATTARVTSTIDAVVRAAVAATTAEAMRKMPAQLQARLATMLPMTAQLEAPVRSSGVIRSALRRYARPERTWQKRDRRRPTELAPGRRRSRLRVLAVIDTSGSMSADALAIANSEIACVAREHDVVIVQCDSMVRSVSRWSGPLREVQGRGSTDLRPPFEPELLASIRPHVIVFVTDGQGIAPTDAPNVPVIWAILHGGTSPAPWGETVVIGEAIART